jgi:hypothetical protein
VIVVIEGSDPDIDRDIQVANEIWSTECEVFVDVLATLLVDRPN